MGAILREIAERFLIAFDENVPAKAYHCPFFNLIFRFHAPQDVEKRTL